MMARPTLKRDDQRWPIAEECPVAENSASDRIQVVGSESEVTNSKGELE
jgi:hypothetical protein